MNPATFFAVFFIIVSVSTIASADRFAGEYGVFKPQLFFHRLNNTPWNDKADEPFRLIRQRLDAQFVTSKPSQSLLASYRKIADESPKDATAQFRWAYAQYLADGRFNSRSNREIAEALARLETPQSYEYVRMQFIYESNEILGYMLAPIAKRLAAKSPEDLEIKYYESWVLVCSQNKHVVVESVQVADELLKTSPNNRRFAWIAAFNREMAYAATKDKKYAQLAIESYKHFLKIAPPDDKNYKPAQFNMKDLQARLAKP